MSFKGMLLKAGISTNGTVQSLGAAIDPDVRLNIGTSPTGIKFSGTYTTTAMQIGDGTTALTLAAADDHAIDIYTTCAIGSNSGSPITPFYLKSTTTGVQSEDRAMSVHSLTNVYSGNENTVGHFYSEWGTAVGIGPLGMCSAVTAKMLLPTSCTGAFYAFYGKMNLPTTPGLQTAGVGGNAAGWFMLSIGGDGLADFSNNGVFMDIHNLTPGATKLLSLTSQTLKSVIDVSTVRYLLISQMEDGVGLGSSSTDMVLGTVLTKRAIEVYTSSASVTGGSSHLPIYMRHTVLGTGGSGHRAEFHTRCDVAAGAWINALKGYMEFDASLTAGRTTGLASAICAEMKMPNYAAQTGEYYPLEIELVGQSNSFTGVGSGFITCRISGNTDGIENNFQFIQVSGLTPLAGNILSADSQTLKCLIGTHATGAARYIVLSTAENGLTLSNTITAHADNMLSIVAASTVTGGSVQPISMVHTMTGAGQVGGRALFEVDANDVEFGGWLSAVKGYMNFNASGSLTGIGSAVLAELNMPGQALVRGTYAPLELELTCPNGMSGLQNFMTCFAYMRASGNTVGVFQQNGFLFDIWGVGTAGGGKLYDTTINDGTTDETLRIRINGVAKYLLIGADPS